jgi:hypothetical protein
VANRISILKSEAVGVQPTASAMASGELAVNYADKKIYGKHPGSGAVVQVAASPIHTHALSDLTQSSASNGQVATWNGTAWVPLTPQSGAFFGATAPNPADFKIWVDTATARVFYWIDDTWVEGNRGENGGVSSWNDLTDKPEEFPPEAHTHSWEDITDPPAFAESSHTHSLNDINDLSALDETYLRAPSNEPITGQVLAYANGPSWEWVTPPVVDPFSSIPTSSTFFCDMDGHPLQSGFLASTQLANLNYNTYPWTGDSLSIGVVAINTTSANGFYFLTQSVNNTFGSQNLLNKSIEMVARAALSHVPDSVTANYRVQIGFGNSSGSTTAEHGNGIYFYADNQNANWICKTARAGTRTETITGVPVTTDFFRFRAIGTSSEIQFFINDSLVATHTTNIPNAANHTISLSFVIQSGGSSAGYSGTKSIFADYIGSKTTLLTGSR